MGESLLLRPQQSKGEMKVSQLWTMWAHLYYSGGRDLVKTCFLHYPENVVMVDSFLGFHSMYTHTKSFGTGTIPPDEIRGRCILFGHICSWMLTLLPQANLLRASNILQSVMSSFTLKSMLNPLGTFYSLTKSSPQHAASCGYDKRVFFWTFDIDHDQLHPQISGRSIKLYFSSHMSCC